MKKLSLLSLLLLWSASCLASDMGIIMVGFGQAIAIAFLGIGIPLYCLMHFTLLALYFRRRIKDKTTPLLKLLAASFINTLLWFSLNIGLYMLLFVVSDLAPFAFTNVLLVFTIMALTMGAIITGMVATALPLYSWLFPTIEKKRLLSMLLFLYLLNPVQGLLTLTQAFQITTEILNPSWGPKGYQKRLAEQHGQRRQENQAANPSEEVMNMEENS